MIVVALLVGISIQFSCFSSISSSSQELPILSFINPFEGLKKVNDYEDYVEHDDEDFVPPIVYVEYKEEKAEVDDFYCYKEEEINNKNDKDHEVLMIYEYDECCGYEEYDDEEISEEDVYSELNDVEFNKRIEEFIDENNKKWREELQNERMNDHLDIYS
ncbi:hypothetical protein ACH5RR_000310 [Cinchona calisaya]|uniref:Uncharacterized protein n=1 Tax=Cinchona calisaya TaxID=153742 RepID=A0ABD3B181_9GENT